MFDRSKENDIGTPTFIKQVTLVMCGGCVPVNRRVYRKRVKQEAYNMPVYFLSDAPWEALICSPRCQYGGASQWNCARNSVGLRGSFYRGRG
jgi:predicted metal-binding protein